MRSLAALCGYSIDWGDVPTWIAGLASIALLGGVAWEYRRQVETDRMKAETEARAQASRVFPITVSFTYPLGTGSPEAVVVVKNLSDLPIYECRLTLLSWGWEEAHEEVSVGRYFTTILPGDSEKQDFLDRHGLKNPPDLEMAGGGLAPPPWQIEFRDAAGQSWCRKPDGRLARAEVARRRGLSQ